MIECQNERDRELFIAVIHVCIAKRLKSMLIIGRQRALVGKGRMIDMHISREAPR